MRKFCFLAVAAAALALLGTDQANAGGRRVRYYSYGRTSSGTTVTQGATGQTAQSTGTRRYSYSPSVQSVNRPFTMGAAPYNNNYYRADRKIRGY
ncbi:MAG TPA: hypothetical protein VG826_02000 [Pirellulales bacterium]|nr:hypothetical protein [Pirellulales bacterium]